MNDIRKLVLVAGLLTLPMSALAYVDPGTGMLVWQGLIASVGAFLVFVRNPWAALKRLIERIRRR